MITRIIIISCLGGILFHWWLNRTVQYGPGVLVPEEPFQQELKTTEVFNHDEFVITAIALFQARAKVLSKKYYSDEGAKLSPVDLALGWGRMSDEAILQEVDISQYNRFYFWKVSTFPIPRREIETHSANMHFIPANDQVATQLDRVKQGDLIGFKGRLVRIDRADGWHWKSSLTREDTGNGACELIWVEAFSILKPPLN
ncbi:MAG: hypothetical protein HQM12_12160 [SAR324 cluster bacterium]|nr:hypothetical protein [SAR324 cluster bacterium]